MPKQSLRIFIEIRKQPVHNKVRFTFDSQSNYHATKWVITIHNAEGKKNQSIASNPERIQMES